MTPPHVAHLTHSTTEYRREARIAYDGLRYDCSVAIGPTWRHDRMNPARFKRPRTDPTAYARQLGMIHFALGPAVLRDFYNTLLTIVQPESPGLTKLHQIWKPDGVWFWTPQQPTNDHQLRGECALFQRIERPFLDVIEEFMRAERQAHRGYKFVQMDYW